jgi:hypothetical protein
MLAAPSAGRRRARRARRRAHLAHDTMFAYLTDPEAGVPLDDEIREAVRAHLPWTRVCRDAVTTFHGERVDLRRFVAEHGELLAVGERLRRGSEVPVFVVEDEGAR